MNQKYWQYQSVETEESVMIAVCNIVRDNRARQLYKNIYVISVSGDKGFIVYKYIIDEYNGFGCLVVVLFFIFIVVSRTKWQYLCVTGQTMWTKR